MHKPGSLLLPFLLAALFFLLSGCGKEPSQEYKQADQILSKARDTYQRKLLHEAGDLLKSAYILDERLKRIPQMAEELELLAEIAAAQANVDSALLLYDKAIEQYRALTDRATVTRLTIDVSTLHQHMGDRKKAYTVLLEALRLARLFKDEQSAAELLWALVPAARSLELYAEEQSYLTELLNAAVTSGDPGEQARVALETGKSLLRRGLHAKSTESLLRALTMAEQAQDSLVVIQSLERLAASYARGGKTKDAFETYTEALRRADMTGNAQILRKDMLIHIGNRYLAAQNFTEAARFYRAALTAAIALGNKLDEGYLFIQLGHCEATPAGKENAMKNYRFAADLFTGVEYHRGASYAYASMARLAIRNGSTTDAIDFSTRAIQLREQSVLSLDPENTYAECERSHPELRGVTVYDGLLELLLQAGRSDEALWYAEKKQQQELSRILGAQEIRTRNDSLTTALQMWRHELGRQRAAEKRLTEILSAGPSVQHLHRDVLNALMRFTTGTQEVAAGIAETWPAFSVITRPDGLRTEKLLQIIPTGSHLIYYVPTRRSLYALVAGNGRLVSVVAAVERDRLLTQTAEYSSLLRLRIDMEDSSADQTRALDRRLDELCSTLFSHLVRPVEGVVVPGSSLKIVLPAELDHTPIHAMRRAGPRSLNKYVIEQNPVTYIPAAHMLMLPPSAPRTTTEVVALGFPGRTGWDVEYELRDIRAFYKDVRSYFDRNATLAVLEREKADVLHVAAEIVYSEIEPGNSFVIFSDGKASGTSKPAGWGELFSIGVYPGIVWSDLAEHTSMSQAGFATTSLLAGSSTVGMTSTPPLRKSKKYFGEVFYSSLLSGAQPEEAMRATYIEMIRSQKYTGSHHWAPYFVWSR